MEWIINSTQELYGLVQAIFQVAGDKKKWMLDGDMGAGKTTFTKAVGQYLGAADEIQSPTFGLVHEYEGPTPFRHLDLYRLKHLQEAIDIGIEDFLDDEQLTLIEWPQLLVPILDPERTLWIKWEHLGGDQRKISIIVHRAASE